MTERRIFLGMPNYGGCSIHAARGFFRACADMSQVVKYHPGGSLLAANFNEIWCAALNHVHGGERLDYFAMLHADVAPQDGWLDALIDEMESTGLDLLGAVTPIKDSRGLTSLALHREGDNWLPLGRLTMRDVLQLPPTFTSDDIGHPLLLNTGCWVIKWNQEICRQLHFEINDRIVFNRAANRYQQETEPEDWFFSRNCHELGLKIGATRKVSLFHWGETAFGNQEPFGRYLFDEEAFTCSPVPSVFPYEIPGWLTPDEGRCLAELARGKRVLEIGSYCGLSTVCMGRTAEHVTACDYFDARGTAIRFDTAPAFRENIERYGLSDKVVMAHPDLPLPFDQYDLVFIDGDHDAAAVAADAVKAMEVLAPGGLIAFHDYHSKIDPGVTESVDAILADGGELLFTEGLVAVVRPPALIPLED